MVGFFIALLSGALMSIQGVFNTEVTKTTGMWVGNAWVQLTAFAVCLIAWLIAGRDNPMVLMKVEPRYLLMGLNFSDCLGLIKNLWNGEK